MQRLNLLLVAHQLCLASTLRVIDNGLGVTQSGLEEKIVDYAILAADEKADLPSQVCQGLVCIFSLHMYTCVSFQFTICSSIATDAFTNAICPFQLLRESGAPWINLCLDGNNLLFKLSVNIS